MKSKKWICLLLTLIMIFSSRLVGSVKEKETIDKEQYLNIRMSYPRTFDCQKATDKSSAQVLTMTMDGLTKLMNDERVDNISPALAEKWEMSKDGKVWTFHLRNAKWTDGKPVTADQFVYAWTRLLDPKNGFGYASFLFDVVGAEEFCAGKGKIEDIGIKAINDKTLQVTLKSPTPYFIQITAFKNLSPTRKDIVEKLGDTYGTDPLEMPTTGAFTIKKFSIGEKNPSHWDAVKVKLEKNPNYWDANKVKLDKINILFIDDEASAHQIFEAKKIDLITANNFYAEKYLKLAEEGKMDKTIVYEPATFYMTYNCKTGGSSKILKNPKVRLAFSLALDREDYVKNIFKKGYPAEGFIPQCIMIGDKEYRKEAPEPLKKLIDNKLNVKALFKEGLHELGMDPNVQYTVKYLDTGTDSLSKSQQEWFKFQWEKALGVKIEFDICKDAQEYWDKVDNTDYDICTYGWIGDFNDPDTYLNLFVTKNFNNPGQWSNAKYDELYKKSKETVNNDERLKYFKEMEQILLIDDCCIAPLFYSVRKEFRHNYVKGVMYTVFGSIDYTYAYTAGRK